jgi:hypothetical protein
VPGQGGEAWVIPLQSKVAVLRAAFLIGAVGDALIAVEWYLISLGLVDMPIHPSFFQGAGQDYRFILGISALFMLGWALLMYWGSRRPMERRAILLLTAGMLFVAILSEGLVFGHLLSAKQLLLGSSAKLLLVMLFAGSYWYSRQ